MSADDDRDVARKLVDELFSDRIGRMPARDGRVLDRDRRRRRAPHGLSVDDALADLRERGIVPPDDDAAA